jgi:hypothetical protein
VTEAILPEAVLRKQAEQEHEDAAGRAAVALPLPGPLMEAFSHSGPIKVGDYSVRQFVDADFELLQELGNPIIGFIEAALAGDKEAAERAEKSIIPRISRGKHAWELCWILTNPPEKADDLATAGGCAAVRKEAKVAFGNRLPSSAIVPIVDACVTQMIKSFATRLEFGPAEDPEKNGGATSAPNP